jgi:hypothetical protein
MDARGVVGFPRKNGVSSCEIARHVDHRIRHKTHSGSFDNKLSGQIDENFHWSVSSEHAQKTPRETDRNRRQR